MEVLFDIQPEPLAERIVVGVHHGGHRRDRANAGAIYNTTPLQAHAASAAEWVRPDLALLEGREKNALGASSQTATCERLRYVRKASIAWAIRTLTLSMIRHAIAA